MAAYYDVHGTLRGAIIDILLEYLSYKIEMWEAEEIADLIIEEMIG